MKSIQYKLFKSGFAILLPVALLACACSDQSKKEPVATTAVPKITTVKVISPVQRQPLYKLTVPGELVPFEQVTIYPKIKGFVKKIFVDRGSVVKKGQLLALLEAPEVNEKYQSSRSDQQKYYEDYLYSRQSFDRLKKAAEKNGAVAAIELDKARSKLRADSSAYASAKSTTSASAQLSDYLRITAPFDGVIVDRNISVGALVGENMTTSLFVVAQNQRLRLTVAIPEKHAASVSTGTDVTFTVSDHPGKVYHSKLSRDGKLLQQSTRSVTVEFDVNNKDMSLSGGEYAQVLLMLRRPEPTLWIPATSVVHAQSGIFILDADSGRIKRIPVVEGIRQDSLQEVFGQLKPDLKIVKNGTEELAEGTKIKTKN
ncbi:efflux RND transporter periplasmic adaptor subunit [Mucilaginibacter sp. PAMB04274]|uniref:efflux RND transporter periplasmic adaptor subunit n=1 Tax=Mucilaginibacter sp. PAMB04274 TaxID=3138568 RepID=UPI0031F6E4D5